MATSLPQAAASFAAFPKVRPELPEAHRRLYEAQYKSNRTGATPAASAAQTMESWLHRQVASDIPAGRPPASVRTLEIGAGTLNQLPYEAASSAYDIVEPFEHLFEDSPELHRIRAVYADITDVPSSERYDRITSVAAFEHICDLPDVIARAALLLAPAGCLRVAIPSEGTFLWTLGWRLTTGLEYRLRHGLDYGVLMRHEHVNTADEIEAVLRHFFTETRCRVMGLSKGLSLYRFYECRGPDAAAAAGHLAGD